MEEGAREMVPDGVGEITVGAEMVVAEFSDLQSYTRAYPTRQGGTKS